LLVAWSGPSTRPLAPVLQLSSTELLVSSLQPIAGGKRWLAYFYNPSESAKKVTLRWSNGLPLSIRTSDASGAIGDRVEHVAVAAFDSAYFVISQGDDASDVRMARIESLKK
jgi:hypothetical protein